MRRLKTSDYLTKMVRGYIDCMLWSSLDWTAVGPDDNAPCLDESYGPDDLTIAAYNDCVRTCRGFLDYCKETGVPTDEQDASRNGHDLWLTSEGHGTGFWDRGLTHGDALSKAAKLFTGSFYSRRGRVHSGY